MVHPYLRLNFVQGIKKNLELAFLPSYLQENANHSDAIRLLQSLSKGVILWIPVNQVKLSSVFYSVHGVLRAVVIRGAPVKMELAKSVGSRERTTPQHCE